MAKFEIETREIEWKYKADEIKLDAFTKWVAEKQLVKELEVSSWDIYYAGKGLPFEFLRYRGGPSPELTIKMKISDSNQNRFELNLPLRSGIAEWIVKKFCETIGFQENFRVFKHCFIYWFEKVDVVYYIVYDKTMAEKARFIEIEARQDYPFASEEEAWESLRAVEAELAKIGITAANRMKRSMWDIFKKDI